MVRVKNVEVARGDTAAIYGSLLRISSEKELPNLLLIPKEESEVKEEIRLILGHLETFAAKVKDGLQIGSSRVQEAR